MDRLGRARGFAGHYARLLRSTPGHVWSAADVIARLALLLGVVLFLFLGSQGTIPPWLIVVSVAVFVVFALLWAEYDRYETETGMRDAENKLLRIRLRDAQDEWLIAPTYRRMIEGLTTIDMYGHDELRRKIERREGSEAEWTADFDRWDHHMARMIGSFDAAEVVSYQRPIDPVSLPGDAAGRLLALLATRKTRIEDIQARLLRGLDDKAAERKKRQAELVQAERAMPSRRSTPSTPKAPNQ